VNVKQSEPYAQQARAAKSIGALLSSYVLFSALSITACVSVSGCASNASLAQNETCPKCASGRAEDNNGGKVDRFALGRAALYRSSDE
jgi:hypothetical protein